MASALTHYFKRLLRPCGDVAQKKVITSLIYRDFITVGLLVDQLKVCDNCQGERRPIRDNWIYIQEPDVRVGRLQVFNNWSPAMVADPSLLWLGLEYFCYQTDDLWKMSDAELIALAEEEMERVGILEKSSVRDATVIRVEKAYPRLPRGRMTANVRKGVAATPCPLRGENILPFSLEGLGIAIAIDCHCG